MKQFFVILLIILSVLGIADASYLTYEKFLNVIPSCGDGFDCGAVLNSPYASIGPIPLSTFGIGYYLSVLVLAAALLLEVPTPNILKKYNLSLSWLLFLQTSFGFGFSVLLVGIMAFVIKAWCLFCLLSAATSTALFACSLGLQYFERKEKKS